MKATVNEWGEGLEITIEPEAELLRYSKNANSEKPFVYMHFDNEPYCYICLKKRKTSVQNNSIDPQTK